MALAAPTSSTNFGDGPVRDSGPGAPMSPAEDDFDPLDEARMLACGQRRSASASVVSLYAPNGRVVGSPFYAGKLAWYERLRAGSTRRPIPPSRSSRRRLQHRPGRRRRLGSARPPTAGRTSRSASAPRSATLLDWGLVDAYRERRPEPGRFTWWDYRAGMFHKNFGMRIDHLLATRPVAERVVLGGDRPRGPQGHADAVGPRPAVLDLDGPGRPFDAGWAEAGERIAARSGLRPG